MANGRRCRRKERERKKGKEGERKEKERERNRPGRSLLPLLLKNRVNKCPDSDGRTIFISTPIFGVRPNGGKIGTVFRRAFQMQTAWLTKQRAAGLVSLRYRKAADHLNENKTNYSFAQTFQKQKLMPEFFSIESPPCLSAGRSGAGSCWPAGPPGFSAVPPLSCPALVAS